MKDSNTDSAAKVKGNIITTVTPERKAEEEKSEQENALMDPVDTLDPAVSTPLQHDTKVNYCFNRFGKAYNVSPSFQRSRAYFLEAF